MSVINLSAKLDRTDSSTPWGFRLHGGKDFFAPLSIQRVTPGSLAAKCGLLVGDVILKIGGAPTENLRHKDAQAQILSSGNSLELSLRRGGDSGVPPAVEPQHSPQSSWNASAPQPYTAEEEVEAAPTSVNYNVTPKPFSAAGGVGAVHAQYNSPLNLYSNSNVADTLVAQTTSLHISGGSGSHSASQASAGVPKPTSTFTPSGGVWRPTVPTGPRTMKTGRAGEARSMPAAGGSDRIPMCHGCGVAIRGPFVSALDKTWCPDHFTCANPQCRRSLIDIGFVEEAGQLYCEMDYEQYLAPRCAKCSSAIMGEIVNALKNTYHMNCFLCAQCHQPIGKGSFHNEDGKIYCQKDWAALFQTKCYGCQFPIEPGDRWVEALNQNWHSECFNCSTCQINLEGQPFYAKGGKPFCKKHAMGRF